MPCLDYGSGRYFQIGYNGGEEMRVRYSTCQNIIISITPKGKRFYCKSKGVWIPARKLERNHRCGHYYSLEDKILTEVGANKQQFFGDDNPLKTPLMRALEREHGQPLEKLLVDGSLSMVSEKLRVDTSTVSKWIKKLGLRENGK
jgi:hypothetical protein